MTACPRRNGRVESHDRDCPPAPSRRDVRLRADDLGLEAVENRVPVNDFYATLSGTPGLDHAQATARHDGRDERLTDVARAVAASVSE